MNKVVFFEIPAENLRRAQDFYQSVFGWRMQPYGTDVVLATTVETDEKQVPMEPGAINGDLYQASEPGRHPSVVMEVTDIEFHVEKIKEAGGQVIKRKDTSGLAISRHSRIAKEMSWESGKSRPESCWVFVANPVIRSVSS